MTRSTIAATALLLFTALVILNAGRVGAADGQTDEGGVLTTSFTYHAGTTDTPETARGLASRWCTLSVTLAVTSSVLEDMQ